ncbi:MAG TPA: SBBP repeat-containing protein, partial [Stellaceae bacterium]
AGSGLLYSTYLGGSGLDVGYGIAVDAAGDAYVTGFTNSTNFPTTAGAFQTTFAGGGVDAFVTKLNVAGSGLLYSTYLGGSSIDLGYGIAADAAGNAYVTGVTASTNFPTTAGSFQTTNNGTYDAFVTKLAFGLSCPAGTPEYSNCHGQCVSALAHQYGGISAAANALGYSSVPALQTAIGAFCRA